MKKFDRKLVLEDGSEYYGYGFGDYAERVTEIVFNTSMVGYQEIVSDPSYTYQSVVMTYPLIGNYGMTDWDYETKSPTIGGLIVKEYNDRPSNFGAKESLGDVMKRYGITGISGVDTRKLTRSIRDFGSRKVLITAADTPKEKALEILAKTDVPTDAVRKVSCKKPWKSKCKGANYDIVAVDCGIKHNIIRSLVKRGCNVTVVPYNTTADQIDVLAPDGVFFSNGPGDPTDVGCVVELIKQLRGRYPIFGICLGHQLIALSYGAKTYKLKFGHRGGNHPVRKLADGKIEITSQNHSYAVDKESLKGTPLKITHVNILDDTVEGLECEEDGVFSVQYHPESCPGPQDSSYLFDKFLKIIEEGKHNA